VQDIAAERGTFKTKIPGLSADRQKIVFRLLAVFVLATRAAHKNRHSDILLCKIVCKMHVAYLSLWNGEQSNSGLCDNYFKHWWCLVASVQNDYNAGHLREIFGNAFIN
jgi:hypothetical protein